MRLPAITKYGFRVRTRDGMVVDNLLIHARDESEAERKLRQMYPGCEVMECVCQVSDGGARPQSMNFEDIVSLIAR